MKENSGLNEARSLAFLLVTTAEIVVACITGGFTAPGFAQGAPDILWAASGHSKEINAVAFSPDGALLASASDDFTIKLWRVADGSLLRTLTGHQQDVQSVAFSPDGTQLYSGGKDNTIRVWQIPQGTLLQTVAEGNVTGWSNIQPRHALALSHDGQWIATGRTFWNVTGANWVGLVQVRQVTNMALLAELPLTNAEIRCLVFTPDGNWLAAGSQWLGGSGIRAGMTLWQTAAANWAKTLLGQATQETNNVESVAFSPDGTRLAASVQSPWSGVSQIRVWRMADGTLERTLASNAGRAREIAFSPDSTALAAANWDATLTLWALDGTARWTQRGGDSFRTVAFSPDGEYLASGSKDDIVALWRSTDGANVLRFTAHGEPVQDLLFSPNGRLLASWAGGPDDFTIKLWDTREGALLWSSNCYNGNILAFSPDSETLAIGSALYQARDGKSLRSRPSSWEPTAVAFSPDGTLLAIGTYQWLIELWRPADGVLLRSFTNYYDPVGKLAFSTDGKYLVSAGENYAYDPWCAVKFWRISDGALLNSVPADTFAWSDMDQSLALVSWGSPDVLTFFNWSEERLNLKAPGFLMLNRFLNFSPDLNYAVSSGETWLDFRRVADQSLIQRYDQEADNITSFAFTRDGRFVAYGRQDASLIFARNPVGGITATSQPPVITVQPQSQTVEAGQEAVLWVKARGTEPLAYEWHAHGAVLPGATNCVSVLHPGAPAHSETCFVILRNAFGSATSQVATLTITTPPTIIAQPQSQIVNIGAAVSFQVSATAPDPLTYQWRFNGRDLGGATNRALTLHSVRPEDSGGYAVLVTGPSSGTKASAPATLVVLTPLRELWNTKYATGYASIESAAFSPDGSKVNAVTSIAQYDEDHWRMDTVVRLWSASNGLPCGIYTMTDSSKYQQVVAPDGTRAARISGLDGNILRLWWVTNDRPANLLLSNSYYTARVFSPDGQLFAASTYSDTWVWRTSEASLVRIFSNSTAYALTFSPAGDYLASAGGQNSIQIWQVATGRRIFNLDQPIYGMTRLALSPDGSLLATGGDDRVVRFWNVSDATLLRTMPGHLANIASMAFSREGALLGVVRGDGAFELWRTADGLLLPLSFNTPLSSVRKVAFSPTANLLVLVGEDLSGSELRVVDYTAALQPTPPRLSIRPAPGAGTLTLDGEAGRQYSVLASTNLTSWIEVTNFTSSSAVSEIPDPGPRYPARFYRAIAR
jgi:WD40 repeat protein